MVRGSIDRMKLKEFDRQIGALFGLAKGCFVLHFDHFIRCDFIR